MGNNVKSRKENASHTLLDSNVSTTMNVYKAQVDSIQNHTHKLRNTQKVRCNSD